VACLFRGAPSCMYSQLVMKAIEEYQKSGVSDKKNEEQNRLTVNKK